MRKNILNFVYALAALITAATPASAQVIVNGGFETGTFTGWSTAANASISTGFNQNAWLVTPANTYMARIEPVGGQTRSSAEAFLGLSSGSLVAFNPTIFNPTTNYGSIKQSVFMLAGQSITAYWNYVSTDYVPFNDGAIAVLVGPGGQQIKLLAVTESAYGSPGAIVTGSYGSTDWRTVSFTASATGYFTFGFTTFNDADQVLNPILFLDDAAGGTSAPGEPVVTTDAATNITNNSATTGGNVTSDGGSPVTARGVVYSTAPLPTLANSSTSDGTGTGTFVSNLSGLTPGTTYYVRAYASNSVGTSYGNQVIFTTLACTIAASATSTNVMCNGGSDGTIDLTVTGASGSVSYSWSNGATTEDLTGLPAGTYSVTVTDANNCTATATVTISEPAALSASATATDALCNGGNGSVDLTVSGGTVPYSYSWNNGATTEDLTGVPAGTYDVTVTDANGCTTTASATVNEPTAISASTTATDVLCNGGTDGAVDLTVSGGTPGYSYLWSNGATTEDLSSVSAGTYSVTITDANGCTATASATVSEPTALANSGTTTNVDCNGNATGAIDQTTTGGTAPYAYSWSNGATTEDISGLTAGTYTVTVTDAHGCSTTGSYTITEPDVLAVSGTTTNVDCNGNATGSIDQTTTGGTAPYSYLWSNGATTEDISGLTAGTYSVTVTDANGCTTTASYSITEPEVLSCNTSVSPNPTVAGQQPYTIFLGYGPQCVTLTATASGGTAPYNYVWSNGATTDTTTVCPTVTTIYTVTITDANGCITTCTRTIYVKDVRDGNKIFVCHIPPGNPGNANTISISSNAVAAHLAHGDYLGACNSTGRMISNGEAEEVAEAMHFHVYPNPTSGMFTIELPQTGTTEVVITDVAGSVIVKQSIKDNTQQELQFNLGNEAKGIYFIRVVNGGEVYQSKITLQ